MVRKFPKFKYKILTALHDPTVSLSILYKQQVHHTVHECLSPNMEKIFFHIYGMPSRCTSPCHSHVIPRILDDVVCVPAATH
jgi:hypothetical protein